MTRQDIIRMAREAGLAKYGNGLREGIYPFMESIDRFAELVAAAAKAEEREACAKVCDDMESDGYPTIEHQQCAAAIRARGVASIRGETK